MHQHNLHERYHDSVLFGAQGEIYDGYEAVPLAGDFALN